MSIGLQLLIVAPIALVWPITCLIIGLVKPTEKINKMLFFVSLGLTAFITICSLVYSPSNILPNNVWGGIVLGAWIGGGLSMLWNGTAWLTLYLLT